MCIISPAATHKEHQALLLQPEDHTLLSNRAAAYLGQGYPDLALADAQQCVQLAPSWPKASFRLASCLAALGEWSAAAQVAVHALGLAPDSQELAALAQEAQGRVLGVELGSRFQRKTLADDVATSLTNHRKPVALWVACGLQAAELRALEEQLSQSLAAPGAWRPADWAWKPLWPGGCLTPGTPAAARGREGAAAAAEPRAGARAGVGVGAEQGVQAVLRAYAQALSSLGRPAALLAALRDAPRCRAYAEALHAAVQLKGRAGGGVHVLAVGTAPMLLALSAAASLAQLPHYRQPHSRRPAHLFPPPQGPQTRGEEGQGQQGQGLEQQPGLAGPTTLTLPSRLDVMCELSEEGWVGMAAGGSVDLSALNPARWYPGPAPVELLHGTRHRPLSAPHLVASIDLQAVLGQAVREQAALQTTTRGRGACCPQGVRPQVAELQVTADGSGVFNALHLWAVLRFGPIGGHWVLDTGCHRATAPAARVEAHAAAYLCLSLLLPGWHFDMVADEPRNTAYHQAIRWAVAEQTKRKPSGSPGVAVLDVGAGSGILSVLAASNAKSDPSAMSMSRRAGASQVWAVESNAGTADLCAKVLAYNGVAANVTVLHKDARYLTVAGRKSGSNLPPDMDRPADVLVFEVFDSGLIGEGALHILAAAQLCGLLAPGASIVPAGAKVFCQPIELNPLPCSHCSLPGSPSGGLAAGCLAGFQWQPEYQGLDLRPLSPQPPPPSPHLTQPSIPTHSSSSSSSPGGGGGSNGAHKCTCGFYHSPGGQWRPLAEALPVMDFDFYNVLDHLQPQQRTLTFTASTAGCLNAIAFWFDLHLLPPGPGKSPPTSSAQPAGGGRGAGGVSGPAAPLVLHTGPLQRPEASRTWQVAVQHLGQAQRWVDAGQQLQPASSTPHHTQQPTAAPHPTEARAPPLPSPPPPSGALPAQPAAAAPPRALQPPAQAARATHSTAQAQPSGQTTALLRAQGRGGWQEARSVG
ncbi:S-adenosyl-L-methionine-dependent methyltransferase [Haematococcus lacustris]